MIKQKGLYRKFDGKEYQLYASADTKEDVEAIKTFINKRDQSKSVRTIKHSKSISAYKYGVYIH